MQTISDTQIKRDHARSESEHGHWLKDLEIWENQTIRAEQIMTSMHTLIDEFNAQAETHKKFIDEHRQILRMHEDALSWEKDHPKKDDQTAAINLHNKQEEIHEEQRRVHATLQDLRNQIVGEVAGLAAVFNLSH